MCVSGGNSTHTHVLAYGNQSMQWPLPLSLALSHSLSRSRALSCLSLSVSLSLSLPPFSLSLSVCVCVQRGGPARHAPYTLPQTTLHTRMNAHHTHSLKPPCIHTQHRPSVVLHAMQLVRRVPACQRAVANGQGHRRYIYMYVCMQTLYKHTHTHTHTHPTKLAWRVPRKASAGQ